MTLSRPLPPQHLHEPGVLFEPAPEVLAFLHAAFVRPGAPFHRDEYAHLAEARIGVLWTNVERVKHGLFTLGRAELFRVSGDRWTTGRGVLQVAEWFADWWQDAVDPLPHFLITLYAPYVANADDASVCALLAHELRHCGQKRDTYGAPMFDRVTGEPLFAIQGHDVEEFVSVVEDFGIAAAGPQALQLVQAAQREPRFTASRVAGVCGCGAKLQAAA